MSSKILNSIKNYGVNAKVKNNVYFSHNQQNTQQEECIVTYPVGKVIEFQNTNGTRQNITSTGENITAMTMFADRKYLALATKGKQPEIDIYDIKDKQKKRTLSYPQVGSNEFICIEQSRCGKFFIAQGGAPDYNLVLWRAIGDGGKASHLKYKPITHICSSTPERDPVFQCSISPDSQQFCVTGNGIFKLYVLEDGQLKITQSALGKRDSEIYLAHVWLSDTKLAVANDHGDIFLYENGEYRLLSSSPSDNLSINTMIKYEKGFICGGENGVVTVFDQSDDDKEGYRRSRTLKLDNDNNLYEAIDQTILNFAYDPQTEFLALTTISGQIYIVNLSRSEILKETETIKFNYLGQPFHFKEVTGIDTCIQKPYVATCGMDKTVRILDYEKDEMILQQKFNTECYSLTLHPSGLYVVVGFTDKLKYMKILGNKLEEEKFFAIRKCLCVKFSNGGQFFAALNGTVIHIYSSYTMEQLHTLRGHAGRIRSLFWQPQDTHICSVAMDGSAYEFHVKKEEKINENLVKQCNFSDVISDGKYMYAVGNDATLRLFQDGMDHQLHPTGNEAIVHLSYSKKYRRLFGGMEDGSVCVYNVSNLSKYDERYFAHGGCITGMALSYNENLLFTIADNSMFVFEVAKETRKITDMRYSEEILISLTDLMDKNDKIQDLEAKYADVKSDNEYQQRMKELEFNQRVKEQANNFRMEMKQKIEKIDQLSSEHTSMNREYDQKLKDQQSRHGREMTELQHQNSQRITSILNQINRLKQEKEKDRVKLLNEAQMSEEQHQLDIQQMNQDGAEQKRAKQNEISRLKDVKNSEMDQYERALQTLMEQHREEIDKLVDSYEQRLEQAKDETVQLKLEKIQKEQVEETHTTRIRQLREKIKRKESKMAEQRAKLEQKKKETESVKKENKEREDTIHEKDKRISDLIKQNQELEKFKFVLDYKIQTLNDQIKPSKNDIANLQADIKRMDVELTDYIDRNKKLKLAIRDLKLKIAANTKEIDSLQDKIKDQKALRSRIRIDIHDVVQSINNKNDLKSKFKVFYQKHAAPNAKSSSSSSTTKKQDIDFDVHKEHERKRAYLEKTVGSLQTKLVKANKTSKGENMRIMNENVVLLKEINQLRREVRILKGRLREKEDFLMGGNEYASNSTSQDHDNLHRQLEMGKMEIHTLRMRIEDLHNDAHSSSRPISRERLPSIS